MLQIQHENNFLPTSKHRQAKVRRFRGICFHNCFIYRSNFVFPKCLETRRHLGSGRKTVNSQGYSELREPIKRAKIAIHCLVNTKAVLLWSTVSNALERSRKTRIVYSLLCTTRTLHIFETSSRIENLLTGFSWIRIDCQLRFYAYLEKIELACTLIFPKKIFEKHGRTDIGL